MKKRTFILFILTFIISFVSATITKNKKKKEAKLESFILADINSNNSINYINISVYDNLQRQAPEAKLELHSSQKRGLSGHPGSIPGWGASVLKNSLQNVYELKEVCYNEV
jgi:hypothetical protein